MMSGSLRDTVTQSLRHDRWVLVRPSLSGACCALDRVIPLMDISEDEVPAAPAPFVVGARCGRARCGTFTVGEKEAVKTPTVQVTALRGLVPHLTGHLLSSLPLRIVHVPLGSVNDFPGLNVLEAFGHGLGSYTNQENFILVASTSDPHLPYQPGYSGEDFVSVWGYSGRQKITTEDYNGLQAAAKFDVLTSLSDCPATAQESSHSKSVKRCGSHLKALRSSISKETPLFAPLVGGPFQDLRKQSTQHVLDSHAAGVYIEALHSSPCADQTEILHGFDDQLEGNIMKLSTGLSTPQEMVFGVSCGIDIFDASNAFAYAELGYAYRLNFKPERGPIQTSYISLWSQTFEENCDCFACQRHTCAYVHHLLVTHEMLATVLLAHHNLYQLLRMFEDVQVAIDDGTFHSTSQEFLKGTAFCVC